MPWTLWGVNITSTQFSTNPELSQVPSLCTPANKASLQLEAALFGSRWEYVKLKELWLAHFTHPEAASTSTTRSGHVLDKVSLVAINQESVSYL
jgi:hypothetical protein